MFCPECKAKLTKKPTKRADLAQGIFECRACGLRWFILKTSAPRKDATRGNLKREVAHEENDIGVL